MQVSFALPDQTSAPDPLELPENGLGLFITQQAFDEVKHKPLETGNRWALTKKLGET